MNRNLRARVEVVFPLLDPGLKRRVYRELLAFALADRAKSRQMRPDGTYIRRQPECGAPSHSMQKLLMRTALGEDISAVLEGE